MVGFAKVPVKVPQTFWPTHPHSPSILKVASGTWAVGGAQFVQLRVVAWEVTARSATAEARMVMNFMADGAVRRVGWDGRGEEEEKWSDLG